MEDPKGEIRTDAEGRKYLYVFPEEIKEVKDEKRSLKEKVEDIIDDGKLNYSNKKKKK